MLELRPGRDPERDELQRHRADCGHELQLSGACRGCGRKPECLLEHRISYYACSSGHDPTHGAFGPERSGRQQHSSRFELDRIHGQRGCDGVSGRPVPGRGLHHLRADRHTDRDELQRRRPDTCHHLSLSRAGHRRGGQRERQLEHRHRRDSGGSGYDGAHGAERADVDGSGREPDQSRLDCGHRQRGRDRLSGGALPRSGLLDLCRDCRADRDELQQYRPRCHDKLQLSRARDRCRRQSRRLLEHCFGYNSDDPGHDAADRAHGSDGDGREYHADRSRLDRIDRQHRGDRLQG